MKRTFVRFVLLLPLLTVTELHANEFVKQEAMLILLAAASAEEPEIAAAIDALVLLTIPGSTEFKTDTQRLIAFAGIGALALYNYEAEDQDYSEKDIFAVNLVVFNIVLAGQLLGLNDRSVYLRDVDAPGSSFDFQLSREGVPEFNWKIGFH